MASTKLFDALKASSEKAWHERDLPEAVKYSDLAWDELFANCLPMSEDDLASAVSGMIVTGREWVKMFTGKHRIHVRD